MTRGFLFFAHNNQQVDYGLMALWTATRVRRHLGVGSSIVADRATLNQLDQTRPGWRTTFDHVIEQESTATQTKRYGEPTNQLTFHNLDRISAWDLTPYSETIVMDTDIAIQTARLNLLWGSNEDFIVCDRSSDLNGIVDDEFKWVSDRSIKFYWATVFYFKKNATTEVFFNTCKWVRNNYSWFSSIYQLPSGPIRNDFIWSIALHTLKHPAPVLPFNLLHSNFEDRLVDMTDSGLKFLTKGALCKIVQDVHVFNKFDLLEQITKELA